MVGRQQPIGWQDFPQAAPEPFVWGQGGAQLSLDEIGQRQKMAQALMQSDYSPVQHWSQGLARVAQNLLGAAELRSLDKQAATAQADQSARIAAALGPDNADLAPLLAGGGVVAKAGLSVLEGRQPKTAAPTELQKNYDWLQSMGRTQDANNLIGRSTQNVQWVTANNPDGTKQLIPVGPNGPLTQGGGDQSALRPVGKLTPIDPSEIGGPASAPGGFPR